MSLNRKLLFESFIEEVKTEYTKNNSIVPYLDKMFEKFETRKVVALLEDFKDPEKSFDKVQKFFMPTIQMLSRTKQDPAVHELNYDDLVSEGLLLLWEIWNKWVKAEFPVVKEKGDDFYMDPEFIQSFKFSFKNKIADIARHATSTGKAHYKAPSLQDPVGKDDGDSLTRLDFVKDPKSNFTQDLEKFDEKGFYAYLLRFIKDPVAMKIIAEYDSPSEALMSLLSDEEYGDIRKIPRSYLVKVLDFPELPIDTPDEKTNYLNTRRRENRVSKAMSEIANVTMKLITDPTIQDRFNIPDDFLK